VLRLARKEYQATEAGELLRRESFLQFGYFSRRVDYDAPTAGMLQCDYKMIVRPIDFDWKYGKHAGLNSSLQIGERYTIPRKNLQAMSLEHGFDVGAADPILARRQADRDVLDLVRHVKEFECEDSDIEPAL